MAYSPLKHFVPLAAALVLAVPAHADDFTDSVAAALEAYEKGDIKAAKEEIDFAAQILAQMKAEGLKAFLPGPMEGWERKDDDGNSGAMAAFGGGQMASAAYWKDEENLTIQIMADNQMVTAMAAMFTNAAMMSSMGKVKRLNGQKVVVTNEGEIQALVDGRIMVQIDGNAPVEIKEAYFEAIDMDGLEEF